MYYFYFRKVSALSIKDMPMTDSYDVMLGVRCLSIATAMTQRS